jgi:hypothetical protein
MALRWLLDPSQHLVTVTAEGDVTRAEIETYLSEIVRATAVGWRKLVDLREVRVGLTEEDVLAIGLRFRQADASGDVGALAVVLPISEPERAMRLLGFLAAAKRPMRLFKTIAPARRWMKTLAIKEGRKA